MPINETLTVNVGDLVYDERQVHHGLGVVVETKPHIQAADILENTNSQNGLRVGLAGTIDPIAVIGSLPLSEVAKGIAASSDIYATIGYDSILSILQSAADRGPTTIKL
jgi:hypothetical protein